MRRTGSWFVALVLFAAGCGGGADTPAPAPRSRVDAVMAHDDGARQLEAFCEVTADADQARALSWPELDGEPPAAGEGYTWYSLWASWCVPCIEEMPRMKRWETKLREEGVAVDIRHVSVDATADDLAAYRAKHADAPDGPRVADQATVDPWLTSLGLDAGAAIPIHLFVDPAGKVRCVRMGAVSDPDYGVVKRILRGG